MDVTRSIKLAVASLFLAGLAAVPAVFGHSGGPPVAYTGAPGEFTCRECHRSFALNAAPGSITIEGAPGTYEPGRDYTITVRIQHPSRIRWGFELTAVTQAGERAGTFTITDSARTQQRSDPDTGVVYVSHRTAGTDAGKTNGTSWSVRWTAPDASAGTVSFYVAGNAANNNRTESGDNIYSTFFDSSAPAVATPFEEVTAEAGLDASAGGSGMAWADYDLDGDQDLFVARDGAPLLYRNDGGRFAATAAAGLPASLGARAAAWGDADNDGRPDLLVATDAGARLLRGGATGFTDVSSSSGLPSSGAVTLGAWSDYDGDGDLDLLLGVESGALLLENDGRGAFADATGAAGLSGVAGARAAAWADYDGDGRVDLFVSTDGSGALFKQNEGGTFTQTAASAGLASASGGRSLAWADYDGDLDLDLFVSGDGALKLYRNGGNGTFGETGSSVGLGGLAGAALAIGDSDGDGYFDLVVSGSGADRLLRFDGATFVDVTSAVGLPDMAGTAAAWVDYDADGSVDLLVLSADGPRLLQNPTEARVVAIRPVTDSDGAVEGADAQADRDALGAVVTLDDDNNFATGAKQIRLIDGGGSAAQAPPLALFSIPTGVTAGVRVTFPDGEGRQTSVSPSSTATTLVGDPDAADVTSVSYKLKNGTSKLNVDGSGFVTDREIVEVNGVAMDETKYPAKKQQNDGTSTRLVGTDTGFDAMVPAGRQVRVTTYDPSTGARSAPALFTRN